MLVPIKKDPIPVFTEVIEIKSNWGGRVDISVNGGGSFEPGGKIGLTIVGGGKLKETTETTKIRGKLDTKGPPGEIFTEIITDEGMRTFRFDPIIQGGSASAKRKIPNENGATLWKYSVTLTPT
jgi:hypothetical protein